MRRPALLTLLTVAGVGAGTLLLRSDRGAPPPAGPRDPGVAECPTRTGREMRLSVAAVRDPRSLAPIGEGGPTLARAEVYRSIAEAPDLESARAMARALVAVLVADSTRDGGGPPAGIVALESELRAALLADDEPSIGGATIALGEATRIEGARLDDAGLLDWLDWVAISEKAAFAVEWVFVSAERFSDDHLAQLIAVVRGGIPADHRARVVRALFLLHARIHRAPEPFLELLGDEVALLRLASVEALLFLDARKFAQRVLEVVGSRPEPERSELLLLVTSTLPPAEAAAFLRELEERWEGVGAGGSWTDVGYRDSGALVPPFRAEADPAVRRKILMAWNAGSVDPAVAERFLVEVLDTDPDPAVRAQSLLALGQTDHPAARRRLEEEARKPQGDPVWEGHVSGGIRNAIAAAPPEWIHRVAIPRARDEIRASPSPEQERRRWREPLRLRDPDLADALDEPW